MILTTSYFLRSVTLIRPCPCHRHTVKPSAWVSISCFHCIRATTGATTKLGFCLGSDKSSAIVWILRHISRFLVIDQRAAYVLPIPISSASIPPFHGPSSCFFIQYRLSFWNGRRVSFKDGCASIGTGVTGTTVFVKSPQTSTSSV